MLFLHLLIIPNVFYRVEVCRLVHLVRHHVRRPDDLVRGAALLELFVLDGV